jgi:hypothetical protein
LIHANEGARLGPGDEGSGGVLASPSTSTLSIIRAPGSRSLGLHAAAEKRVATAWQRRVSVPESERTAAMSWIKGAPADGATTT